MSMQKYSSYIEGQFGESFINFRPLSSENDAFDICHITVAVTATVTVTVTVTVAVTVTVTVTATVTGHN